MMKGVVFLLLLVLGAFSGIVLMIPTVMLLFVHSKRVIGWRRRYVSYISGIYFDYAAALIQMLGGTKIFIYSNTDSETLLGDKSALIICNHRSLVDWMFAGWCYASCLSLNDNLRMILKDSLRSVPVFGWAMQIMMYIFLSRKREQDVPYIKRMLSYLLCTGYTPSLFLFPEGTDLNESNTRKSNAYAQNKSLPSLEYVLYPKPSGLLCCLTTLKEKEESLNLQRDLQKGTKNNENNVNSDNNVNSSNNANNSNNSNNSGNESENGSENSSGYIEIIGNSESDANTRNRNNGNQMNGNNSNNEKNKEHKAESVLSVQPDNAYVQYNESKEGPNTRSKSRESGRIRGSVGGGGGGAGGDSGNNSDSYDNNGDNGDNNDIKSEEKNGNSRSSSPQKQSTLGRQSSGLAKEQNSQASSQISGGNGGGNGVEVGVEKGLQGAAAQGREQSSILTLHDLTIAYNDYKVGKKTTDRSILRGEFPREVHILVDRFLIADIPLEKTALEHWLRASFYRKEKLLKAFYENDGKNEEIKNIPNRIGQTKNWPEKINIKVNTKKPICFVSIWILLISLSLYFFIWYRWFVVVMVITCIAVRTFNGFDSVELALHGDMVLREAFLSQEKNEKDGENKEEKEKEKTN